MSTGSISTLTAPAHAPVRTSGFRFELATPDGQRGTSALQPQRRNAWRDPLFV